MVELRGCIIACRGDVARRVFHREEIAIGGIIGSQRIGEDCVGAVIALAGDIASGGGCGRA